MNRAAFVAAAVAALIGVALLWLYMQRFEEESSGGAPVAIVMATMDIPLGATLTQAMIGIRNLPSSYIEERHIRAADAERVAAHRNRRRLARAVATPAGWRKSPRRGRLPARTPDSRRCATWRQA